MKRLKKVLAVLGLIAVLSATTVVVTAGPSLSGGATVRATGSDRWSPATKVVAPGTKVTWRNPSGDEHDVTAYAGRWSKSSALDEGASTSARFGRAGTYKYRCTRHSSLNGGRCQGMCGKIVAR